MWAGTIIKHLIECLIIVDIVIASRYKRPDMEFPLGFPKFDYRILEID